MSIPLPGPLQHLLDRSRVKLAPVLPLIAVFAAYKLYRHVIPPRVLPAHDKAVVISGCDTGFGHALAVALDKLGYTVYAGCLTDKGLSAVQSKFRPSSNSQALKLDISQKESMDAFYSKIAAKHKYIWGLVNNAGIGKISPMDWESMDSFRQLMEINLFGHVYMMKKFLPLLCIQKDARIVNVASASGFISAAGMSAYAASKYGLEAVSDALRREMFSWDVKVSIIEPGFMATAIIEGKEQKTKEMWDSVPPETKARYGERYFHEMTNAHTVTKAIDRAEDPMLVVKDMIHAINSPSPHIRYRPGYQSKVIHAWSRLPAGINDGFFKLAGRGVPRPVAFDTGAHY